MNEQIDRWLDEQLKKVVDSKKIEFDSEGWKQKYSAEYQTLVSRAEKRPNRLRFIWMRQLLRIAAVVAVVAVVIFFVLRRPEKQIELTIIAKPQQSPAVMLSRLSLMLAYKRGGLDAVDEQCEKAFKMLGQKNANVSISELLNENNGKKAERKEL